MKKIAGSAEEQTFASQTDAPWVLLMSSEKALLFEMRQALMVMSLAAIKVAKLRHPN